MINHNPGASVHISEENGNRVHVRFFVGDYEQVAEFTFDDLDQLVGCGNAFAKAYQFLISLNTRGYMATVETFGLELGPHNIDLTDVDLTVEDILGGMNE